MGVTLSCTVALGKAWCGEAATQAERLNSDRFTELTSQRVIPQRDVDVNTYAGLVSDVLYECADPCRKEAGGKRCDMSVGRWARPMSGPDDARAWRSVVSTVCGGEGLQQLSR